MRTMNRFSRFLLTLAALVASLGVAPQARAEPVDLLLVLAADVSRSVDHQKFILQREGYAAAVSNPQVLDAIRSGPHGKIALNFLEWSGYGAQKVVIDWTAIDGPAAARRSAISWWRRRARLRIALRSVAASTLRSSNSSARRLSRAPTIDVSGDGTNNAGRDVRLARDEAVNKGIVINGLVILSERPAALESGAHQSAGRA